MILGRKDGLSEPIVFMTQLNEQNLEVIPHPLSVLPFFQEGEAYLVVGVGGVLATDLR